jgi:hypothetical protein
MKRFIGLAIFLASGLLVACPEGTHAETKTRQDYVCAPATEYKCEFVTTTDPLTGEIKTEWVCGYVTVNKCEWVTTTYEECVVDSTPVWPDPEPEPIQPPHEPASLDTLKLGDDVIVLRRTYLQVGSEILTVIYPGKRLSVKKIHASGWFFTDMKIGGQIKSGWVKVPHVYIARE